MEITKIKSQVLQDILGSNTDQIAEFTGLNKATRLKIQSEMRELLKLERGNDHLAGNTRLFESILAVVDSVFPEGLTKLSGFVSQPVGDNHKISALSWSEGVHRLDVQGVPSGITHLEPSERMTPEIINYQFAAGSNEVLSVARIKARLIDVTVNGISSLMLSETQSEINTNICIGLSGVSGTKATSITINGSSASLENNFPYISLLVLKDSSVILKPDVPTFIEHIVLINSEMSLIGEPVKVGSLSHYNSNYSVFVTYQENALNPSEAGVYSADPFGQSRVLFDQMLNR